MGDVAASATATTKARLWVRVPLLFALIAAAAAALFVQPRVIAAVRANELEAIAVAVAPAVFLVVVLLVAVDAWRVARRRGYFAGRNLLVLGACVAFLGMLLPGAFEEYRARTAAPIASTSHYEALLASKDARVRALVMEAAGYRPVPSSEVKDILARGLGDADPLVVEAALAAVEHRSGSLLEGPEAPARARAILESW